MEARHVRVYQRGCLVKVFRIQSLAIIVSHDNIENYTVYLMGDNLLITVHRDVIRPIYPEVHDFALVTRGPHIGLF